MNPEIKQEWIAELRSGKHAQTVGALERLKPLVDGDGNDVYPAGKCCLGVLCEIAVKHGIIEPVDVSDEMAGERVAYPDATLAGKVFTNSALLPRVVMEWAGMNDDNGVYKVDDNYTETLAQKNDSGSSFNEIADLIEKHF